MNINININIGYTRQVFDALGEPETITLSYSTGVPFPQVGDYVETKFDAGVHPLKVIERKFAFASNSQRIHLLLDLPS